MFQKFRTELKRVNSLFIFFATSYLRSIHKTEQKTIKLTSVNIAKKTKINLKNIFLISMYTRIFKRQCTQTII